MWTLISNPIVSHLLTAFLGAGGAWYATHRTAAKTAAAAIGALASTVNQAVSTAAADVKKVV